jgi:hypothetical protein
VELTGVQRGFAALSDAATRLESVGKTRPPMIFGRDRVAQSMAASATDALTKAREGVDLLGSDPRADAIRGAIELHTTAIDGTLTSAQMLRTAAAQAGAALRTSIADGMPEVEQGKELVNARFREIIALPLDSSGPEQEQELTRLVLDLPPALRPDAADQVGERSIESMRSMHRTDFLHTMDRHISAWRYAIRPPASTSETTQRVTELASKPFSELTVDERYELRTLFLDLPKKSRPESGRTIDGETIADVVKLPSYTSEYRAKLPRHLSAWRIAHNPPLTAAEVQQRTIDLLAKPYEDLSEQDCAELVTLIYHLPKNLRAHGPTTGMNVSLQQALEKLHGNPDAYKTTVEAYARAWQFTADPSFTRSDATALVMKHFARGNSYPTQKDRTELRALLFVLPKELAPVGRRSIGTAFLWDLLAYRDFDAPSTQMQFKRIAAEWRLSGISAGDAAQRMGDFLNQPIAALSMDDCAEWQTVVEAFPEVVRTAMPSSEQQPVTRLLRDLEKRPTAAIPQLERRATAWKYNNNMPDLTVDQVRERVRELVQIAPAELTASKRMELAVLLYDMPKRFHLEGPHDGIGDITLANLFTKFDARVENHRTALGDYLLEWRMTFDPALREQFDSDLNSLLDGEPMSPLLRTMSPNRLSSIADKKIEASTGWHQVGRAGYALGLPTTHDTANVTRALERVKRALDEIPVDTGDPLLEDTRRLVDVNMQRLRGVTPAGEVTGFEGYPDFAQIGTIRANTAMLRLRGD